MIAYPEILAKLASIKQKMLNTVDFTKPYETIMNCVEYIGILEKNLSDVDGSADRQKRYGNLMRIVQMSRGLYDSVNWHKFPDIDQEILDTMNAANAIIDAEKLRPFQS